MNPVIRHNFDPVNVAVDREILRAAFQERDAQVRQWRDWALLALICSLAIAVLVIAVAVAWWLQIPRGMTMEGTRLSGLSLPVPGPLEVDPRDTAQILGSRGDHDRTNTSADTAGPGGIKGGDADTLGGRIHLADEEIRAITKRLNQIESESGRNIDETARPSRPGSEGRLSPPSRVGAAAFGPKGAETTTDGGVVTGAEDAPGRANVTSVDPSAITNSRGHTAAETTLSNPSLAMDGAGLPPTAESGLPTASASPGTGTANDDEQPRGREPGVGRVAERSGSREDSPSGGGRPSNSVAGELVRNGLASTDALSSGQNMQEPGGLQGLRAGTESRVGANSRRTSQHEAEAGAPVPPRAADVPSLVEVEQREEAEVLRERLSSLRDEKRALEEAIRAKDESVARLDELAQDLERRLKKEIAEGKVGVDRAEKGLRLQLAEEVLFPSGSAALDSRGRSLLMSVAEQLRKSGYRIRVEGHTDSNPIAGDLKTRYPSNWELAGARAASVVRLLELAGIDQALLEATSFGSARPVVGNTDPRNRAQNRRIDITLIDVE